jgi:RNA polymerase sigma-70 factor (ECF subfamily)
VDGVRGQIKAGERETYIDDLDRRTVPSAEDSSLERLQSDEVRVALAALTPEQRDVVLLRFVADLSLDEVAAITGRNTGAVKQLQRRGIQQLRRHLNGAIPTNPITSVPALPIAEL